MSLNSLHTAVKTLLEADRTANASEWPADCVVKTDPRVFFWDDTQAPEVRICHDPNSVQLEDLGQGRTRKIDVQVMVGLSRRIDSGEEFEEFLTWGQYLFDLLNARTSIDNTWAVSPPGEWAYTYDPDALSPDAGGEPSGRGIGLFLVTVSGTTG